MKTIARLVVCVLAAALLNTARAEDAAPAKPEKAEKAPAQLEDISVTGKLEKSEMIKKDKDGKDVTIVKYLVVSADGQKTLLDKKLADALKIDLTTLEGKTVVAKGKGYSKENKKGEKQTAIKELVSLVEEAAGAAPAAAK